jgi:glutathione S-transferase
MAAKITLYDFRPSGNGYKVRLLLGKLKMDYDYVELDITRGESRTPDFLAINPNGRIPVLQFPDGRVLCESGAILFHLAQGSSFWPEVPWDQALVLQWMFFEQYTHEPSVAVSRFILQHAPPDDPRRSGIPELQKKGHAALAVMEGHLENRSFFIGEAPTIADIALYAYSHVAPEGGISLRDYPALRSWLTRVAALPGHKGIDER